MRSGSRIAIREIAPDDLPQLIELCAEHANYERMSYARDGKLEKLQVALACPDPVLRGWVAASEQSLLAYATATVDFSTWSAERFVHVDCLYVREAHRGHGLGRQLLDAIAREARRCGIRELQWQTPDWNTAADRFYRRVGAIAQAKLRYRLELDRAPRQAAE